MKFKSALVTAISGSIGGMTGSHNKGGLYFRARSVPVNPNTPAQQTVRSIMGNLSVIWNGTLTDAQRQAWDTYAENVTLIDVLGEARTVTGLNHFIRSNVPRVQAGQPRVEDGPTIFNLGFFSDPVISAAAAASAVSVVFDVNDTWANEDDSSAIVLTSRPKSPTINYFKGPYQLAGTIDGDGITPPTSPAVVTNPFAYAVGQKVFAQFRVSRADGRLSLPFLASMIAT